MNRFFVALACAVMVFLGASVAHAALWRCVGGWTATRLDGRGSFTTSAASVTLSAPDEASAISEAKRKFAERADLTMYRDPVGNVRECVRFVPPKPRATPAPAPLPSPAIPPKPEQRDWVCRVRLRWHLDSRSKDVDETITIDDASGKTDAEGKAIYRIQQRQRALFRDSEARRMTFSQTTVGCS